MHELGSNSLERESTVGFMISLRKSAYRVIKAWSVDERGGWRADIARDVRRLQLGFVGGRYCGWHLDWLLWFLFLLLYLLYLDFLRPWRRGLLAGTLTLLEDGLG